MVHAGIIVSKRLLQKRNRLGRKGKEREAGREKKREGRGILVHIVIYMAISVESKSDLVLVGQK